VLRGACGTLSARGCDDVSSEHQIIHAYIRNGTNDIP
jgi:hypothetical protein